MYELYGIFFKPAVANLREQALQTDIRPGPGGSHMCADADARQRLEPLLREYWPEIGTISYMTVVALYPSSQIVRHADAPIRGIRHHIPLQQNEQCWSFHDGVWQQLQLERIYTMDPTLPHGAVNWGATVRLHLIVDVLSR